MSRIYSSMEELIGGTPLLELKKIEKEFDLKARVLAKLEYFNPAGSVKDRIAKEMILDAEEKGILKPGATIIEPTSGNTGIGLAAVGTARGYKVILVMPETMSVERRMMMKAYGAEIVLSEGSKGMKGAIAKAEELHAAHYKTTGPEIWEDTDGEVDIFIAGVGTGGTISGVGKYLKEKKPSVEVIAVEPKGSPVLSEGHPGPHKIQGIGAGFVPKTLDTSIYNKVVTAVEEDAYKTAREMGKREGILVGISSGAALSVAIEEAKKEDNKGKTIVVLLPDTGDRYFSTPLFKEE